MPVPLIDHFALITTLVVIQMILGLQIIVGEASIDLFNLSNL